MVILCPAKLFSALFLDDVAPVSYTLQSDISLPIPSFNSFFPNRLCHQQQNAGQISYNRSSSNNNSNYRYNNTNRGRSNININYNNNSKSNSNNNTHFHFFHLPLQTGQHLPSSSTCSSSGQPGSAGHSSAGSTRSHRRWPSLQSHRTHRRGLWLAPCGMETPKCRHSAEEKKPFFFLNVFFLW